MPENSPLALMGRFPLLDGPFSDLNGPFPPQNALMGRLPSPKQSIKKRGIKRILIRGIANFLKIHGRFHGDFYALLTGKVHSSNSANVAETINSMKDWELTNIYHHHHPERKKRKSSEANCGSIHPYSRYGNAVQTRKTISTIAILWLVKAILEKRAAAVGGRYFDFP